MRNYYSLLKEWIYLVPKEKVLAEAKALEQQAAGMSKVCSLIPVHSFFDLGRSTEDFATAWLDLCRERQPHGAS